MFTVLLWSVASSKREVRRVSPMIEEYLTRAGRYAPAQAREFASEAAMLAALSPGGRLRLVLLDSAGALWSSEELAASMREARDGGWAGYVLAIGPPDGWSPAARARADASLSLGRITLPHHLAQLIAAEQLYRGLTILAGHPYHCGH